MAKDGIIKNANRYLIKNLGISEVFVLKDFSEVENPLVMYEGIHTIKITNKDNIDGFSLSSNKIIPGYLDADNGARTLDLTTSNPKLFITLQGSYYHFLMDNATDIIEALEQYPDHELIVDVSGITHIMELGKVANTFFYEFLIMLKYHNIKHKVVKLLDYDVVYMDHFRLISYAITSSIEAHKLYEFFLPYVQYVDEKPFRNVYVSRRKADINTPRKLEVPEAGLIYDGLRIDDEQALEDLFRDYGFEIVYPEDFHGFDEQINFFHSVKTIASLTSSGLSNAVFMQPGGVVIEVTSPIIASPISEDGVEGSVQKSIHNFYKDISFLKQHTHLSIQNPNYKFEEVKNAIDSNPALKAFLDVRHEQANNI